MNATPAKPAAAATFLQSVMREQRPHWVQVAWMSVVNGLLTLTPSWFMFEVYGRVLNSRNKTTLFWELMMVLGVYLVLELLDLVRGRLLHHIGENIDARVRARLFDAAFDANLKRLPGGNTQPFNDLRTLRDFVSTPAVTAVFDAPAALICLAALFAIGPWLGVMALLGAGLQGLLALLTERRTMPLLTDAQRASIQAQGYASSSLRNAQVIESMGMLGAIHARWMRLQRRFLARQAEASDYGGFSATGARLVQSMQSSLLLGGAAFLLLNRELWGGGSMLIIASILGGRVLQPLAQLVAQWRLVVAVRDAYARLDLMLGKAPQEDPHMPLPAPKGQLSVEGVLAGAPGSATPILRGVTFAVNAGEIVGVIGPSASGKSTLARLLTGIWPAAGGKVRLDGADVHSWRKEELGPYLGYLPQTVELFDGTVAENIARFGDIDMDKVRAAVAQVGMADVIEALPHGYDTRIGQDGAVLSGGQRQRLGLARALYGEPRLLVLDEPNSSLDEAGEKALLQMLLALKARGVTVVAITHRTALMPALDKLLVMKDGQAAFFGPRDDVIAALKKANDQARQLAAAAANPGAAARPALPGGAV